MSTFGNSGELEKEVRRVIELAIEKDISAVNLDDNIINKMGLDSMTALEIMAAVEERFKIRIQEQDLPRITSLRSITDILIFHLEKKGK